MNYWYYDKKFNVRICPDGLAYNVPNGYRVWFYFSVLGIPINKSITIKICDMNNQLPLFSAGMKPVFKTASNPIWKRIPGKVTFESSETDFSIQFVHLNKEPKIEKVYFAFCYPFSYEDCEKMLDDYEKLYKEHKSIYYNREVPILSNEGRKLNLLTITSHLNKTETREPAIEKMFANKENINLRPFIFKKPTIFLSARVHPGELPGSLILNGLLNFLLSDCEQARILRDCYVFKIIPMLNPDGVSRGQYRMDAIGQNLNRFYIQPSPTLQPTIYAAKMLIIQQSNFKQLSAYIDLHGHACKKSCFIYGNALQGKDQIENMLLPKLISFNTPNFDFAQCNFTEQLMTTKDKRDGSSREGAARVAIYKDTGLINCYTMECNYNTNKRVCVIPPKFNKLTMQIEREEISMKKPNLYTLDTFYEIGVAICLALLDWVDKNPISRVPSSSAKTLPNIRNELKKYCTSITAFKKLSKPK